VTVIDGATDSVVATVGVDSEPRALVWNSVQSRVYVANWRGSSISVLGDSGFTRVDDALKPASRSKPMPTIVRGVLVLGAVGSRQNTAYRADLLNIAGRKVLGLLPGANDVRALAPGVYFVREPQASSSKPQAVRKVVVAR
jgi:hypothetical protein